MKSIHKEYIVILKVFVLKHFFLFVIWFTPDHEANINC